MLSSPTLKRRFAGTPGAPPRGTRGFSLTEMLVVLALMGIAFSIAIPNMINGLRQSRAKRAADEISIAFDYARGLAISDNLLVRAVVDIDAGTVSVLRGAASSGEWDTDWDTATGNPVKVVRLPSGTLFRDPIGLTANRVTVDDPSAGDCNCLLFQPLGTIGTSDGAYNTSGNSSLDNGIHVSDNYDKNFYQVRVNAVGIIKVRWWDGANFVER